MPDLIHYYSDFDKLFGTGNVKNLLSDSKISGKQRRQIHMNMNFFRNFYISG
jgi:hypothetical protein